MRDLLHLVNHPDFDRAQQQIEHLGGCTEPIRLTGHTTTADTTTGEVLRSYTTSEEPTGSLLTACGNRRASRCPACSRLYAADTYHLVRAGLSGGKTVPDTARTHPRVFVTLTPPSFDPVHNRLIIPGGDVRLCRCRKLHGLDDALIGTPLNPATYDYEGAILFNAHASALWARFTTYLRRELAAGLGKTQKAAHAVLRVSFAKVAEYQQRGLVHFHAVIRLDGPDGSSQPPPPYATAAVRHCRRTHQGRPRRCRAGPRHGRLGCGRGTRTRLGRTVRRARDRLLRHRRRIHRSGRGRLRGEVRHQVRRRLRRPRPCPVLPPLRGTRRHRAAPRNAAPVHRVRRHRAGSAAVPARRRPARAADDPHLLGAGKAAGVRPPEALEVGAHARLPGPLLHQVRAYSTTLGALRAARRAWRTEQARVHASLPEPTPDSTLVVGHWAYQGSGYSPGGALLAAAVWHRRELERQFTAEGGC
ncbi:hypothetical protein EV190_104137 [Actinorugispora endophytica]|uniref:Replication initiation protein n=1 Tax=Actinorugispora endophytica TaxID=1605990 RepID=A0A4R6V3Q9_9ACTN|nr:hypothetical protein EV190_104137 [Actinorugispora endophytica]